MPATPTARPRVDWMDGLRGAAAFFVMLHHFSGRFDQLFPPDRADMPHVAIGKAFGAELFFLVSGYVTIGMLMRRRSAGDFVVQRFSRLWPAYAVAVLYTTAVLWAYGGLTVPTVPEALVNLTMLEGFVGVPYVDGAHWSLTTQLLFYGWMLVLWRLGWLPRIEVVIAVWVSLHTLNRAVLIPMGYGSELWSTLWMNVGPYYFFAGVLLSRILSDGATPLRVGLLAYDLVMSYFGVDAACTGVIATSLGVILLAERGFLRILEWRPLQRLGAISYPVYLVHQMPGYVLIDVGRAHGVPSIVPVIAAMALAIGVGAVVHHAVEEPAMRAIRDGWKRRRNVAAAIGQRSALARRMLGAIGFVDPPAPPV